MGSKQAMNLLQHPSKENLEAAFSVAWLVARSENPIIMALVAALGEEPVRMAFRQGFLAGMDKMCDYITEAMKKP